MIELCMNLQQEELKELTKEQFLQNQSRVMEVKIIKKFLKSEDVLAIGKIIRGATRYALQRFVSSKTFDPQFIEEEPFTDEELEALRKKLTPRLINDVVIR